MPTSLYDLSVPNYLQVLGAVAGYLDKGHAHLTANGANLDEVVETRLFPDMLPFRFQIQSVAHHSQNAVQSLVTGKFAPPGDLGPLDYAALQKLVADAREALQRVDRAELDARAGRDVVFQIRDRAIPFTTENFVLSFSLPNFHFHATTGYDILRMKGVPIGKRDFLGQLRVKS